jgi:hypothetical protein
VASPKASAAASAHPATALATDAALAEAATSPSVSSINYHAGAVLAATTTGDATIHPEPALQISVSAAPSAAPAPAPATAQPMDLGVTELSPTVSQQGNTTGLHSSPTPRPPPKADERQQGLEPEPPLLGKRLSRRRIGSRRAVVVMMCGSKCRSE